MSSLEVGFSHDIFVDMANEAKNLVLFTEKGQVHPFVQLLQMDHSSLQSSHIFSSLPP
jgi:cleavage and polyadenylation specificity factor subunit 2